MSASQSIGTTNPNYQLHSGMCHKKPAVWLLILFISYTNIAAVLFTPAIPSIMHAMHISQSAVSTITVFFLIGYAFGQLIYGPINNKYGRKMALYVGFSLAVLGESLSILACYHQLFYLLLLGRLLTATGACAGYSMTFAIIYDCYPERQARKILAMILFAFALAPGLAIMLGGFLAEGMGWQSSFYSLNAYGVVLFCLVYFLPETNTHLDERPIRIIKIGYQYLHTLKNKKFVLYGLACSVWSALLYTYYSNAPLIAENNFHYTAKQYGIISFITAMGYVCGNLLSLILANKISTERVIHYGIGLIFLGIIGISLLSAHWLPWHVLYFIAVGACFAGGAMFYSSSIVLGLKGVTNISMAAAMFGTINLLGAIACTSLVSLFNKPNLDNFLFVYLSLLIILLSLNFFTKTRYSFNQ